MPTTGRTGRESETPYLDAWEPLWNAGWRPFPLPKGKKHPPPAGVTGEFGISPSYPDCLDWASNGGRAIEAGNVGLRLPKGDDTNYGVVALDVDHYVKDGVHKRGYDSIQLMEKDWGPLPDTWRSTARGAENPSGARLFRVPAGSKINTDKLPNVDAIHYGFRYIVVAPSYNPSSRSSYQWIKPNGDVSEHPPTISDLPPLPKEWLEGLVQPTAVITHVASIKVDKFFESLPTGAPCSSMEKALQEESLNLKIDGAERHKAILNGVMRILRLGEQGHKGAMQAVDQLANRFIATVSGDGSRTVEEAKGEFQRTVISADGTSKAVSHVLSEPTPADRKGCSCLTPKQVKQREAAQAKKREEEEAAKEREIEMAKEVEEKIAAKDDYDQFNDEFEHVTFRAGIHNNYLQLASEVKKNLPVEVDRTRTLWHYQNGQYTKEGSESWVKLIADRLLGEATNLDHKSNAVDVLKNQRPRITQDDVDSRYINVRNGMLNWKTGELLPHDPSYYSISQVHVEWNPEAKCPRFDQYLNEVLPPDAHDLAYEIIGYTLLNDLPIHKAVMLYGPTSRNGKGTFIRVLTALIGEENISHVPPQKLDSSRFERASLFGMTANLVGDVSASKFAETGVFKSLTGGDTIAAEHKGEKSFSFKNRATMIFGLNEYPQSLDTTQGFFSRWIVLPFPNTFLGKEDTNLTQKLTTKQELEGIFAKAITSLQTLMERGQFEIPLSVKMETNSFKDEANPTRDFISEQVLITEEKGDRGGKVILDKRDIYQRYRGWMKANGYEKQILGKIQFNNEFRSLAPEVLNLDKLEDGRRKGNPGYMGLKLNPEIKFSEID